jgi:glucose/arabinose dehydrogenase
MVSICAVVTAQAPKLPAPFATPSTRNAAQVVPRPDGAQLKVPAGFEISVYADNLDRPRLMVPAPNGDLFVAQSAAGSVVVLRDANNDGTPEMRSVYAQGLPGVFGIAFHEGYVCFGRTDSIVRFKYQAGDTTAKGTPEKLVDLPTGGHSTRNVLFSRDGKKMYVAVGSQSNKSAGENPIRAAINEYNPDGTGARIFASGLRNPVGMTWQPGKDILWTAVNERDTLGDDLVPDYITSVKDGGFYGWPYSYIGSNPDPEHVGKMPDLVKRAIVPDVLIPAHSAALGITFYTGSQFPQHYRDGAFVGLHGSWNRSTPVGYRVAFVPFQNGKPSGPIEDFVTGWILSATPASTWGRPVGVLVARDGSLLIADDGGSRIWRVRYTGR